MYRLVILALISAFAVIARAATVINCEDATKSVKVSLTFAKKDSNSPPKKVSITSSGKSKAVENKHVAKFIRNPNDFYILFKVQTKAGLHELELNTRFNKNQRGAPTSTGILINKTQDERVNVTCRF